MNHDQTINILMGKVSVLEERVNRLAVAVDGEVDESSIRGMRNRLRVAESKLHILETRLLLPTWKPEVPNEGKTAHVPSVFKPTREAAVVPSIYAELEEDNKRLRERNESLKAMYKQNREWRNKLVDLRDKLFAQIAELEQQVATETDNDKPQSHTELHQRLADMHRSNEALREENEKLKIQLADCAKAAQEEHAEVVAKGETIEKLEQQIEKERINWHESDQELMRVIKKRNVTIDSLETQVANLRSELE